MLAEPLAALGLGDYRASLPRTARQVAAGRRIIVGRNFWLRGSHRIANTAPGGFLRLGVGEVGFLDRRVGGLLRVEGSLVTTGTTEIRQGCRVTIGPDAVVRIGDGTIFGSDCLVAIINSFETGTGCYIGWGAQILDTDFHQVAVGDAEWGPRDVPVRFGDRVWLGSNCSIYAGTNLADGIVVAGGSHVRGVFDEPDCLIGGGPAKVIRRNIRWRS